MYASFSSKPRSATTGTVHLPPSSNHNAINAPNGRSRTTLPHSNQNAATNSRDQTKVVGLTGDDEHDEPRTGVHHAKNKTGSNTRRLPTLSQFARHKNWSKPYTPRETHSELTHKSKLADRLGVDMNEPQNRSQNRQFHQNLNPTIKGTKERVTIEVAFEDSSATREGHPNNSGSQAPEGCTEPTPTVEVNTGINEEAIHETTKLNSLSGITEQVLIGDHKNSMSNMGSSKKGNIEDGRVALDKHTGHDSNRRIVDGGVSDCIRTNAGSTTSEHSANIAGAGDGAAILKFGWCSENRAYNHPLPHDKAAKAITGRWWAYHSSNPEVPKGSFGHFEILLSVDHRDTIRVECIQGYAKVEENCLNCYNTPDWCWNKRPNAIERMIIERQRGEGYEAIK
ncbi:hypothetical protein GQ44DRAFT_731026 [Phaeosphaeriaceae sp. PMI808]|nr:hypothetical protein GQ44DRAFT_731026 [Phaeosphaeriaceae sp. PMI808]